ncbi:endonuclease/exonuclease/phosphatase family protein [Streptomyces sp. NPDC093252]|uniref:endonuclease/exonuclease/phosphatase family protein n=1 Tax=Streptomyces sp. NPDC093252 TaxID=3154980 RepID=UPI003438F1DD
MPRRGPRLVLAVLLLVPVTAVLGFRLADADGVTPVPQLLAFLPWLLAPAGLGLLLAGLARWWTGVVWGVALLGLLAWYIEPYGTVERPGGTPLATVRVLTSNVEFGGGTAALIGLVRDERPDLVFVQECDRHCDGRLRAELAGEDPADAHPTDRHSADRRPSDRHPAHTYPYRAAVEGEGSAGSLILSRFPLTPAEPLPGTLGMPGAVADVGGHDVRVQLAHPMPPLPAGLDVWREELDVLRDWARAHADAPAILAGDFNATQDHAAFRRVLDAGMRDAARLTGHDRTPTWPARTAPPLGAQIDHVLVSRDFSARATRFLDPAGTDHRAVLAELTLHAPE